MPYSLTPASTTVVEGNTTITFTVTRSGSFPAETIYASTLTGTATSAGLDYDARVNLPVVFTAGQTTAMFTVTVREDTLIEGDEQFRVMIGATTSAGSAQALDISTVTITDDDAPVTPTYSLTPASTTVEEGNTTITFTVTRSGAFPAETIYASTLTGTATSADLDYDARVNLPVVFTAGQTTATFTVTVREDTLVEGNEQFRVMIGATTSAGSAQALDISTVTITDDDAPVTPTYSLTPASTTVEEGNTTITFTVTRSGAFPAETIYASTLTGTATSADLDYDARVNLPVVFTAGQTTASFTVTVREDTLVEGNEQFRVMIGATTGAGSAQALDISDITITDDDSSSVTYNISPSSTSVTEGGQVTFTITRSPGAPAETIYFSAWQDTASFDAGDYAMTNGARPENIAVTFGAGDTTRTVTLNILNDGTADSGERFRAIVQSNPPSSNPAVNLAQSGFVTINDAGSGVTYSISPSATAVTEGGQVTFTITRSAGGPAETVYFSAWQDTASFDGGDYAMTNGARPENIAVTFGAGDTTRTVTLNILNDGVADSGERFRAIVQSNPPSSNPAVNLAQTGFVTISDGTNSPPTITGPSSLSAEVNQSISFVGLIGAQDSDGSVEQYRFSDSTPGAGYLTLDGQRISGTTVTVLTSQLNRVGYFTGASAGNNAIAIEAIDDDGAVSPSYLTTTITVTAPAQPGDTAGQTRATARDLGTITSGAYTLTEAVGVTDAADYFRIELTQAGTLQASISSMSADADLFLLTQSGSILDQSRASGSANDTVSYQVNAGVYYLNVDSYAGSTSYLLQYNFTPGSAPPASGWSIAGPGTVQESNNAISFTITRPAGLAEQTIYVSTTTDHGSDNALDYLGLVSVPYTFAEGQTTRVVTVQLRDDGAAEQTETFGFIVQGSLDDAFGDRLAATSFTITDSDITPPQSQQLSSQAIFDTYGPRGDIGFLGTLALAAYRLAPGEVGNASGQSLNSSAASAYGAADQFLYLLGANDIALSGGAIANGIYTNDNAAALVGVSADGIFIAFRGTNDNTLGDAAMLEAANGRGTPDVDDWMSETSSDPEGMARHWALFQPLLAAIETYRVANGIGHVYVTGHSLGSAMAQRYMSTSLGNSVYSAITFASPGFEGIADVADSRTLTFNIEEDIVPNGSWAWHYGEVGREIEIRNGSAIQITTNAPMADFHDPVLYQAFAMLLARGGNDLSRNTIYLNYHDTGSGVWNVLYPHGLVTGSNSADSLHSTSGADILNGLDGDDFLYAGDGGDEVFGGAGWDFVVGGAGGGDDIYDGGSDIDTLSYESTSQGIVVDLSRAQDQATGAEIGVDQIVSFENIIGGAGNDQLIGDNAMNSLNGGGGNDSLDGGAGADILNGGDGNDTIIYDAADSAANVQGGAGSDVLVFTSGSAPTSFDLGAHGFETAEGRFTDTGANPWATRTDFYDAQWRLDTSITINDDGSRDTTDFDQANSVSWSSYLTRQDALGRTTETALTYDDGGRDTTNYDVDNSVFWSSFVTRADTLGRTTETLLIHDDGTRDTTNVDAGNSQFWSSFVTRRDSLGRTTESLLIHDDGTRDTTNYDADNSQFWSSFVTRRDSLGRTTESLLIHDDGTRDTTNYDADNSQFWSSFVTRRDSLGRQTESLLIHDDGTRDTTNFDAENNVFWSSFVTRRDALGRTTDTLLIYDDGRRDSTDYDEANVNPWANVVYRYDGSGALYQTIITYDDGHVVTI